MTAIIFLADTDHLLLLPQIIKVLPSFKLFLKNIIKTRIFILSTGFIHDE